MTAYLELDDALRVVGRYGFHVRDAGMLGSALARPATTVMYQDAYAGLNLKAAAQLESVARNHPLLEGNKPTAWTLMVLFLWINGCRHDFGTNAAFNLVTGVAAGTTDLDDSAKLIGDHTVSRAVPLEPAGGGILPARDILRTHRREGWRLEDIARHYAVETAAVRDTIAPE